MTALDAWFLICMLFVAMAMFEYAILLSIKFGKQNRITAEKSPGEEKQEQEKCRIIDLYVLRAFIVAHVLTICTYFLCYTLQTK